MELIRSKKDSKITPKSRLDIVKDNKFKSFNKRGRSIKLTKLGAFKKTKLGKIILRGCLGMIGVFTLVVVLAGVYVLMYLQQQAKNIPTPSAVFPSVPLATEIYDRNGVLLYRMSGNDSNRDIVNIADIPNVLKASFMSGEDKQFYNHHGFDSQAIIRCLLDDYILKHGVVCGASTITQQLIKLTSKDSNQTLQRKIDELLLSIKVEQNYSKDQIFEMYLRVTPYGGNILGVSTAAKFYFGVTDLKKLTLAQSALLSSIINNPTNLSPTLSGDPQTSQNLLKQRQQYVLDQLSVNLSSINQQLKNNEGKPNEPDIITQKMIDDAKVETISYIPANQNLDIKAGHFVNYVIKDLETKNYNNGQPFTDAELRNGGYRITTTLDWNLQQIAESAVNKGGNSYKYWNVHNAALMTTTPSNGQIITMAGSKSFTGKSEECDSKGQNCKFDPEVDVLTSLVSPGSTNKSMAYMEAFKQGKLYPGSLLPDIPFNIGSYNPKNWDGTYLGYSNTTVKDMLQQSRNLPALEVIQAIGVSAYLNDAKAFGYTSYDASKVGPSIVLGGAYVYPVEHVQGYGVFANDGDFVPLDPILTITNLNSSVTQVTDYTAKPVKKQVGDPQAIYLLNQTLNRLNAEGVNVGFDNRDVAGKTGTTENNTNAEIMMYSPDFVTYGWAGNNNNDPLSANYGYPTYVVSPWLMPYMRSIAGSSYLSKKTQFPRPGFVYQGGGDCDSNGQCLGLTRDWLIQGREPARGDIVKKNITVCSDQQDKVARPIDIQLGYGVSKEFAYYKDVSPDLQHYLDDYIKQKNNNIPNGGPTDPCNINRTGGVPFFKLNSVTASTTSTINIQGGIYTAEGTIVSVTFYLNGIALSGCSAPNVSTININCDISKLNLDNGTYQFKATATDSQNNVGNLTPFNLVVGSAVSSNFTFTTLPPSPIVTYIPGTKYPVSVKYTFAGSPTISSAKLCEIKDGNLTGCTLMSPASGSTFTTQWIPSGGAVPANYVLYVTATSTGGDSLQSSNNSVTVK